MTATVNRADLAWALAAVLPHTGRAPLDCVGMHSEDDQLLVYATDRYTAGIARLPVEGAIPGPHVLSLSEAKDLERFSRVSRVAHQQHSVGLMTSDVLYGYDDSYDDRELHVILMDGDVSPEQWDSAVFWQRPPVLRFERLWDAVSQVLQSMPERLGIESREYTYQPALLARFSKAERSKEDRLRMFPYAIEGAFARTHALVTVGDNFIGAVAGLYQGEGIEPILASWFKEGVAA